MFEKSLFPCLVAIDALALSATAVYAVTIDTVTVGNPGNANDTDGDGHGGVSYVYNISKYEVTAGQFSQFLNAVAAEDTYGLYNAFMDSVPSGCQITQHGASGNYTYDFSGRPSGEESDWANRPVNYVSWGDAARFANWLHNGQPTGLQGLTTTEDGAYYLNGATTDAALLAVSREPDWKWAISSEDEWYKAAYHKNDGITGNYFDYPTSNDSVPSNDLINPDPGNNATFYVIGGDYTIGDPYYRTEFSAHENSGSPYGTYDQYGNVWEWNEAVLYGSSRGLRGGSFYSQVRQPPPSVPQYSYYPTFEVDSVGFRVANIPEPSTLFLLTAAAVAFAFSYWRTPCWPIVWAGYRRVHAPAPAGRRTWSAWRSIVAREQRRTWRSVSAARRLVKGGCPPPVLDGQPPGRT